MQLSQRLLTFLKTLNPNAYPKLCEEFEVPDAAKQFLFTFGLLFLVMLLLFVPAIFVGAPKLAAAVGSFGSLSFSGNVSASQPVVLLNDPLVVVDLSQNATLGKETLLFTGTGVEWRRFYLFGHASKSWSELSDAKAYSENEYTVLLLFLAPSLAFWLGALLLAKDIVLILLFSLLAYLIPKVWRFRISYADSLKVALFASSIMLFVEMVLLPFDRLFLFPLLLFAVFLVIGVAIVGERDLGRERPARKKPHHEKSEPWE